MLQPSVVAISYLYLFGGSEFAATAARAHLSSPGAVQVLAGVPTKDGGVQGSPAPPESEGRESKGGRLARTSEIPNGRLSTGGTLQVEHPWPAAVRDSRDAVESRAPMPGPLPSACDGRRVLAGGRYLVGRQLHG